MANRDVSSNRERKYQCKLCPKRFTSSSVLTKHIRVHTGERPYECKTCLRSFSQLTNLKRHQKIHIKDQTFECKYCDETFSQLAPLLRHENSHTVQETTDYSQDIPSQTYPVIPFRNQTAVPSSSNANSNRAGIKKTSVQVSTKNLTSLSNFLQIPSSNIKDDDIFASNQALSMNADDFEQLIQTSFESGNISHANNPQTSETFFHDSNDAILVSDESQESLSSGQEINPKYSEDLDVQPPRVNLGLSTNPSVNSQKYFYDPSERNNSSFDFALRAPSDELEVIDIKPDLSVLAATNYINKLSPVNNTFNISNATLQLVSSSQDDFADSQGGDYKDIFETEQVPVESIQYFKSESELCFDNNDLSQNPSIAVESMFSRNNKDKPGLSAREELSESSLRAYLAVKNPGISEPRKPRSEVEVINLEDFSSKEMKSDEQHNWSVPLVDIQEITTQKLDPENDFKNQTIEIEDGPSEEPNLAGTKIKTSLLVKRIETHTDKRPSACDHCRRPFSELTNLKNQERKPHLRNGTLHCQFCEKTFPRSFQLLNHLKYHARSIQRNIKALEVEVKQKQRKKISKKSLKASTNQKYLKMKPKSMQLSKKNVNPSNGRNSSIQVLDLKRSLSDPRFNAISPTKNDENLNTQDIRNTEMKKSLIGQKCLQSVGVSENLMRNTSSESFVENIAGKFANLSGTYKQEEEEEDVDQIEFLFSVKASEEQNNVNTDSGSSARLLRSKRNSSHILETNKSIQNDTVQIPPSESGYHIEYRENLAQKDILPIPSSSNAPAKSGGPFHCRFCNKPFNRRFILIKHLRTHTGEKPFKCDFCPRSFSQSSNLNRHKKLHLPHGLFPCKLCPARFPSISELNTHNKKQHIGMKPLSCRFCSKRFSHSSVLMAHLQTHTGEKRFVCELCNRAFTRSTNLNRHMKVHVPGRVFRCRYCSHTFKHFYSLKRHLKTHLHSGKTSNEDAFIRKRKRQHSIQQMLSRRTRPSKSNLICKLFESNEQRLPRRIQSFQVKTENLGSKPGSLRVSGIFPGLFKTNSFQHSSNLQPYEETLPNVTGTPEILAINGHLFPAINNRLPPTIQKNPVALNSGEKSSISCNFDDGSNEDVFIKCESGLEKSIEQETSPQSQIEFDAADRNSIIPVLHLKRSHSNLQFNAILPEKDENTPGDEHLSEVIFPTSNCADEANESSPLKAPAKSGGPFHCRFCNKPFNRRFILIKHLRTHTGEKPFKCEFCPRSFSQTSNLNRHKKLHLPHGLFPCKLCPARFPSISELNTHNKKQHIGMKPLNCRFCSKKFSHSSVLMAHLQTHTGEKRFVCEFCNRSFTRSTNLNRHMKIHTSNGNSVGILETAAPKNRAKTNSRSKNLFTDNYETVGESLENEDAITLVSPVDSSSVNVKLEPEDLNIEKQLESVPSDSLRRNQSIVPFREFRCTYCNKLFHHRQVLRRHLRSQHKSEMMTTTTCQLCHTSFPDSDTLNRHRKTCSQLLLPYFCNLCKEKFPNSSELSRHRQRKHSGGVKHFSCRYCSKVFAKNNALTKHIRTHTGEKPYTCELCQRPFSQATNLKRHQKIHARNGLFVCKFCQASFSQLCHLSQHLHMHTGE